MALSLRKGGSLSLSKNALRQVRFGLSWEEGPAGQPRRDADITAVALTGDDPRRVRGEDWVVFYNQVASPGGEMKHSGDERRGAKDGDDESIVIDLTRIPADVTEIAFVATIHDAAKRVAVFPDGGRRGQDWALLNATATLYDDGSDDVIATYPLGTDYAGLTAVQPVSLTRTGDGWTYTALGAGSKQTLFAYLKAWGADVEE